MLPTAFSTVGGIRDKLAHPLLVTNNPCTWACWDDNYLSGNKYCGSDLLSVNATHVLIWLRKSGWNSTWCYIQSCAIGETERPVPLSFPNCCSAYLMLFYCEAINTIQFVDNNVITFGVSFSRFLNSSFWRLWIKFYIFLKQIVTAFTKIIWVCIICSLKHFSPFDFCKFLIIHHFSGRL